MAEETLVLASCGLSTLPDLSEDGVVRRLDLRSNQIARLGPPQCLATLGQVVSLDLYSNQLQDLAGIQDLRSLRVLHVGMNQLTTLSHLSSLRLLEVLDCHSNRLEGVEGLQGLQQLRVANLAGNRIRQLQDLRGLTSLTDLNLRRNALDGLEAPGSGSCTLPSSLRRLMLSHNRLRSLEALQPLRQLPALEEVSLEGAGPWARGLSPVDYRRAALTACPPGIRRLDMAEVLPSERQGIQQQFPQARPQQVPAEARANGSSSGGAPPHQAAGHSQTPTTTALMQILHSAHWQMPNLPSAAGTSYGAAAASAPAAAAGVAYPPYQQQQQQGMLGAMQRLSVGSHAANQEHRHTYSQPSLQGYHPTMAHAGTTTGQKPFLVQLPSSAQQQPGSMPHYGAQYQQQFPQPRHATHQAGQSACGQPRVQQQQAWQQQQQPSRPQNQQPPPLQQPLPQHQEDQADGGLTHRSIAGPPLMTSFSLSDLETEQQEEAAGAGPAVQGSGPATFATDARRDAPRQHSSGRARVQGSGPAAQAVRQHQPAPAGSSWQRPRSSSAGGYYSGHGQAGPSSAAGAAPARRQTAHHTPSPVKDEGEDDCGHVDSPRKSMRSLQSLYKQQQLMQQQAKRSNSKLRASTVGHRSGDLQQLIDDTAQAGDQEQNPAQAAAGAAGSRRLTLEGGSALPVASGARSIPPPQQLPQAQAGSSTGLNAKPAATSPVPHKSVDFDRGEHEVLVSLLEAALAHGSDGGRSFNPAAVLKAVAQATVALRSAREAQQQGSSPQPGQHMSPDPRQAGPAQADAQPQQQEQQPRLQEAPGARRRATGDARRVSESVVSLGALQEAAASASALPAAEQGSLEGGGAGRQGTGRATEAWGGDAPAACSGHGEMRWPPVVDARLWDQVWEEVLAQLLDEGSAGVVPRSRLRPWADGAVPEPPPGLSACTWASSSWSAWGY